MWEPYVLWDLSIDAILLSCPLQSAVTEVMERMDDYYISKEDWDTIIELGVDEKKDDTVLKKISTATKTALTKKCVNFNYALCFKFAHGISCPEFRYNSSEHPIPFHKAQDLGKVPKKLAGGPAPDLEEAYVSLPDGSSAKNSLMFTT